MKLIVVLALILLLPQEKNVPKDLFQKMEAKLVRAKTIRVKVMGSLEKPRRTETTCELLLDEGNKARVDVTVKIDKDSRSSQSISDGKTVEFTTAEGTKLQQYTTPEKFGKLVRKALASGGGFLAVDAFTESNAQLDPESAYSVSEFALLPKETVGDIEAEVVEYSLTTKHPPDLQVRVWIDPKTHLPLKRTLTSKRQISEETYTEIKLDEKIDPATFEHPKSR